MTDDLHNWVRGQFDKDERRAREALEAVTDNLPDWLRAQLDEDERIARAATPGPWRAGVRSGLDAVDGDGWTVCNASDVDVAHVARHDPARVLREIDAKRELLRQYEHLKHEVMPDDMSGVFALEAVIRAHAEVYDARSGYKESWRP